MEGYIKLGNQRENSLSKPEIGETVIYIDRTNPIFGNPFRTTDKTKAERIRVIEAYKNAYSDNVERLQATEELALRVVNGERIRLLCWCYPKKCHGDVIIEKVKEIIRKISPNHPSVKEDKFEWLAEIS